MSDTIYVGTVAMKIASSLKMLERAKNDRYPTPRKDIRLWLQKAYISRQYGSIPVFALDTGCGKDARWMEELKEHVDFPYGIDINEDAGEDSEIPCVIGNYLEHIPKTKGTYNMLVGNPPFNLANAWLQKSFDLIDKDVGRIAYLFPLTLASTKERARMYRTYPISRMLIYTGRIKFEGYTGTYPAREYAQFEWWFKNGRCLSSSELVEYYGLDPIDYLG